MLTNAFGNSVNGMNKDKSTLEMSESTIVKVTSDVRHTDKPGRLMHVVVGVCNELNIKKIEYQQIYSLNLEMSEFLCIKISNISVLLSLWHQSAPPTSSNLEENQTPLPLESENALCGGIPAGISQETSGALTHSPNPQTPLYECPSLLPSSPSQVGGFEAVQSDPWIPPGVCSPGLFSLSTHHLRELRRAKYLELRR